MTIIFSWAACGSRRSEAICILSVILIIKLLIFKRSIILLHRSHNKFFKMNNFLKHQGRRKFVSNSFKISALAAMGSPLLARPSQTEEKVNLTQKYEPLKILILGGTSFLGPHQIAYALERGHQITTFTRGKTKPTIHTDKFDHVESLVGDREDNLEALKGRQWDAVIDNSGHRVHWTEKTAALLKDSVDAYLYTSSTGVFYPYLTENIKEDTQLVRKVPAGINEEEKLEYDYGVMKTNSELAAQNNFGKDRTLIIRPTYMMGPGDRTDRFTYWPIRIPLGGHVLIPGKENDPVQYIDVRDVAEWMIRLLEKKTIGTFNTVGPPSTTGMHGFIYGVHGSFSATCDFIMVEDHEFLKKLDIYWSIPWIMPIGNNFGSARINFEAAVSNGLTYRPLATSCQDIYTWWHSGIIDKERNEKLLMGKNGLMAKEKEVISAWKKKVKD